jgi:hypothetical protein
VKIMGDGGLTSGHGPRITTGSPPKLGTGGPNSSMGEGHTEVSLDSARKGTCTGNKNTGKKG